MTMTAEQLAQQYDLLIANGQLTADTLIALSENEIDSDYFSVTSTNEARGTEVECELSITEFALRASQNVRALLDELERKDKRIAELEARTVTVKLPDVEKWRPIKDVRGQIAYRALVIKTLAAAGINLTVEG